MMNHIFITALVALCGFSTAQQTYNFTVPSNPTEARQVIDPGFHAWSVEFSSLADYSGNSTYPNTLGFNLYWNIRNIGRMPLRVRIGGSSQNDITYIPSQKEGLIGYFASGKDYTYNLTLGPNFVDSFSFWPPDTKFIIGLPYKPLSTYYIPACKAVASLVAPLLGDRLDGLEIGNEWGSWSYQGDPAVFVAAVKEYAYATALAAFGDTYKKIWSIGNFVTPKCQGSLGCYTTDTLLQLGANSEGAVKYANTHQYMQDALSGSWITSQFLLNHNQTKAIVGIHKNLANNATRDGVPYFLGETNSLSTHGKAGASDTYAAALWAIDYVFYTATTNITRLYFHQGTGWRYSAYNPVAAFGTPAGVMGAYYANLFTATALARGNRQIEILVENQTFVAYAIFEHHNHRKPTHLTSIVAVNLQAWNSTNNGTRPEVDLQIPASLINASTTRVTRLTGLGTDLRWGITWGGQGVATDGTLNGTFTQETVSGGKVTLAAAEAVLIYL